MVSCCAQDPLNLAKPKIYGLQGLCSKTVSPAQLDLVQVQHHENLLDFGGTCGNFIDEEYIGSEPSQASNLL